MNKSLSNFFIGLISVVLITLPLNYYVIAELLQTAFGPLQYFMFAYFIILITIIQIALLKVLKGRPQRFVPGFMGALGIKMFLTLIILTVVVYAGLADKVIFGINFMVLYFIFTSYSIFHILKAQRSSIGGKK